MAMTNSPRFGSGLQKYGNGTDPWIGRAGWNAFADTFEALVAQATQGLASARPAADSAKPRRFYWATDTKILSYDTGGTWETVSPTGGFGIPAIFSAAGTEGTDPRSARGDHRHPSPLIYAADRGSFSSNGANVQVAGGVAVNLLGSGTHRLEFRVSGSFVMSSGGAGSAQLTMGGTQTATWKTTVPTTTAGEGQDFGGSRYITTTASSINVSFAWGRTAGSGTAFTDATTIQIFDWGI